jgi:hypothetical protein
MATATPHRPTRRPSPPRVDGFSVDRSATAAGLNLPQRAAERLWAPMLAMGLMGLVAGLLVAFARADAVAAGQDVATIARLQHVQAGATFIGFAGVFSAIVFAIARILGVFRTGGGRIQQAVGSHVLTLRMPVTAKAMIALMAMGTMAIVGAVIAHFIVAGAVVTAAEADLLRSEQWFVALEGVRRIGVSAYLLSITLGLATIVHVLRFQSLRIRDLVPSSARD